MNLNNDNYIKEYRKIQNKINIAKEQLSNLLNNLKLLHVDIANLEQERNCMR